MNNKDREFWEDLKRWDVIVLLETWVEEKGWSKVQEKLPKGYSWGKQWAIREEKKGRARGGILMGIKKEMVEDKEEFNVETEGIVVGEAKLGKEDWRIIGVYVNKGIERMILNVEGWIDRGKKEKSILLGGDFNARVEREGGGVESEGEISRERKAKDEVTNGEGKKLIKWIEEKGWGIMNGCKKGDEGGEYTFTGGRGNTTIDYVIADEEVRERIECIRVGEKIDSDHHPIE